MFSDNLLI